VPGCAQCLSLSGRRGKSSRDTLRTPAPWPFGLALAERRDPGDVAWSHPPCPKAPPWNSRPSVRTSGARLLMGATHGTRSRHCQGVNSAISSQGYSDAMLSQDGARLLAELRLVPGGRLCTVCIGARLGTDHSDALKWIRELILNGDVICGWYQCSACHRLDAVTFLRARGRSSGHGRW
jgi:hypothetical protein